MYVCAPHGMPVYPQRPEKDTDTGFPGTGVYRWL